MSEQKQSECRWVLLRPCFKINDLLLRCCSLSLIVVGICTGLSYILISLLSSISPIAFNDVTGTIPLELFELTGLTHLDLGTYSKHKTKIKLSFGPWFVATNVSSCRALLSIILNENNRETYTYESNIFSGSNEFTGTLPSQLGELKQLRTLRLSKLCAVDR